MAKRCTRCGNFLMDDERFCTRCGENVSNVMPQGGTPASPAGPDNSFGRNEGYTSPTAMNTPPNNGQNPPPYPPPYQAPVYRPANDEMSLGKWVLTIVVTTFFGIISLIFLFVWGFGDGPECRKRYCKAMLITMLIGLGVGLIFMLIFFTVLGNIFNNALADYFSQIRNYSYSYDYDFSQLAASAIAPFLG